MVLLTDELYELMMKHIEDKGVREQIFEEQIPIKNEDRDAICSALETDINYWENGLRRHPNEKENIVRHMRGYISHDEKLMDIFRR